jgi:hypothetical protein
LVVFAVVADIAHCISGVSVKIGDVFAGILFNIFYYVNWKLFEIANVFP